MMSKIQILNGTHNYTLYSSFCLLAVYDVKDTNFEWNSQHRLFEWERAGSCLWCQRYKFWMELTTVRSATFLDTRCLWCQRYKFWMELTTEINPFIKLLPLFMMSKIQILNGTHNFIHLAPRIKHAVYDVKDTNFEWNSQQLA